MKINETNDSKILVIISVLLIFLCGFLSEEVILIIQILLLIFAKKITMPKKIVVFFILIAFHATINIAIGNDELILMIKQLVGIFISIIYYYNTIDNMKKVDFFIDVYIKLSIFIAILCILQQVAYVFHLNFIYDLRWIIKEQLPPSNLKYRSTAIFREPSECALVLFPAFFLSIYYFVGKNKIIYKINKLSAFIICIAYICTFSSAGYIGAIIGLIIIWIEYKHSLKQIGILLVVGIVVSSLYIYIPDFRTRVDDTFKLFTDDSLHISKANISSQTLIINEKVALKNLIYTYGLGSGIGSHSLAYKKMINTIDVQNVVLFLNQEDANSLLLRIVSEFGIIGLLLLLAFVKKYSNLKYKSIYSTYSKMCVAYIILRMLRYGHYFNDGLWGFIIIYMMIKVLENQEIGVKDGT